MSLRERLSLASVNPMALRDTRAAETPAEASHAYQQMKARVHQLLLGRLDLEALEGMAPERLREELAAIVERLLAE
jgi:pilus assembly protein CpaF